MPGIPETGHLEEEHHVVADLKGEEGHLEEAELQQEEEELISKKQLEMLEKK